MLSYVIRWEDRSLTADKEHSWFEPTIRDLCNLSKAEIVSICRCDSPFYNLQHVDLESAQVLSIQYLTLQ